MSDTARPRRRLSRESILDVAETVVNREGPEALSMRRVAEELGSSPMSLYRHVRDKDDLMVLLLDRLAERLPRGRLPRNPRARVLHVFQVFHDGVAENPWIAGVLAAGDAMAPSVLPLIEQILAAFVACGLSPAQAGAAYRLCWQFTVGELIVVHGGRRHVERLGRRPVQQALLESIDPQVMPILAGLVPYWQAARGRDSYSPDLAVIVDGVIDGAS